MSEISVVSNINSSIFKEDYEYPDWFNKKKFIFYNKMLKRLQKLRYLHTQASQYYDKLEYYIFGPSISITALSGIASFLSTSQYVDDNSQNIFGITVGIMASVSSLLQSIASACQFSAKKEAHRTVAEQYNTLIISLKFEIEMPNEEDFCDELEKKIIDIQNKCNYFVPQFIIDKYSKQREKTPKKLRTRSITDSLSKKFNTNNDDDNNDDDNDDNNDENNNDDNNNYNNNIIINVSDANMYADADADLNTDIDINNENRQLLTVNDRRINNV